MTPHACSHRPPSNAPDPLRVEEGWLTETVLVLARGIAADNALDRLPILADAVEEAGCNNFTLLNHLRIGEPHRVDCWALRRLLRATLLLPGGVEMAFAWCPPGSFLMGSPGSEPERMADELQHLVRLTKGFYCGVHPVTQADWKAVMGTDPSHFKGAKLPVEQVSWDDAVTFCQKVRELAGKAVRLPTEAEWEYACRGGTDTPFYWGGELNGTQANCTGTLFHPYGMAARGPSLESTSAVGRYAGEFPHPWGLFDMHGNVWEWCEDWLDTDCYGSGPTTDPVCRDGEQKFRVQRGGSWANSPGRCRAAARYGNPPGASKRFNGLRVVFCLD